MRISFAILVAVVVAFTSCDLASASNSAQLKRLVPGLTNNVEKANGGARFLRKTRAMAFQAKRKRAGGIGTRIKNVLNGNEKLARMFKKTDEKLMSKNIGPGELFKAAKKLEEAGYPAARVEEFLAKANQYDDTYYKTFKELRHYVTNRWKRTRLRQLDKVGQFGQFNNLKNKTKKYRATTNASRLFFKMKFLYNKLSNNHTWE